MKKFKQTLNNVIRGTLKWTTIILVSVYVVYLGITYFTNKNTEEYVQPEKAEPVIQKEEDVNDVAEAERMLAEATAKLDEKEAKLVEEIAAIEAEAQAQIDAREAEIAEINAIRSSF